MALRVELERDLRSLKTILKDLESHKDSLAVAVRHLDGQDKARAIRELRSCRDEIAQTHARIKETDYRWWKKTFGKRDKGT
jgi:hypothetical protein